MVANIPFRSTKYCTSVPTFPKVLKIANPCGISPKIRYSLVLNVLRIAYITSYVLL